MSKHTPEPWVATDRAIKRDNGFGYGEIIANVPGGNTSGPFFVQSNEECEANVSRIVSCVNACTGMEDPAAEIAELKQQRDELLSAAKLAIADCVDLVSTDAGDALISAIDNANGVTK